MASNSGTVVGDMSAMEVAMGGNVNALPTADEFARSLTSLADEHKIVKFYAQHVTEENAAWMERVAKETLIKPTQITSDLTIPTLAGAAIVGLKTTQTTPTTSLTTCALSLNEELIRTLREVAHQNAQFPQHRSRVFAKAVRPLLDVHRTAAQKALGPSSGPALGHSPTSSSGPSSGPANGPHAGPAKVRPLSPAARFSPVGTSTDNSRVTYAIASESVLEGVNPAEMEAAEVIEETLCGLSRWEMWILRLGCIHCT